MTSPVHRRRIVIIDDHPLVRRGLVELIAHEPDLDVCGQAATKAEGIARIAEHRPDLAIVDLALPDGNGLELIKQVRVSHPEVRLLVCSMHDEALYGERVLRAGAAGFVAKQERAETILRALRQVLDGGVYLGPQLAGRVLHRLARQQGAGETSPLAALSDRELEVLGLLADGLSSADIARELGLSAKTVDTYREHIKDKLGLDNANELLRFAMLWRLDAPVAGPPRDGPRGGP